MPVPIVYRTEAHFDALGTTFTQSGVQVVYFTDTTEKYIDDAAGLLMTDGQSSSGWGEVSINNVYLDPYNYISFWARMTEINVEWGYPHVFVGSHEIWRDAPESNTNRAWHEVLIDVSMFDAVANIRFRFTDPSGTGGNRSFWFDYIRLI